jgi:hypothetical protein
MRCASLREEANNQQGESGREEHDGEARRRGRLI